LKYNISRTVNTIRKNYHPFPSLSNKQPFAVRAGGVLKEITQRNPSKQRASSLLEPMGDISYWP